MEETGKRCEGSACFFVKIESLHIKNI